MCVGDCLVFCVVLWKIIGSYWRLEVVVVVVVFEWVLGWVLAVVGFGGWFGMVVVCAWRWTER